MILLAGRRPLGWMSRVNSFHRQVKGNYEIGSSPSSCSRAILIAVDLRGDGRVECPCFPKVFSISGWKYVISTLHGLVA